MSPWGLLDEVNMFRLRTILAILLVGAMASGPAAVAASNGNVPAESAGALVSAFSPLAVLPDTLPRLPSRQGLSDVLRACLHALLGKLIPDGRAHF